MLHEEYAKALFLLTEELGTSDAALADVSLCRDALFENSSYVRLTDSPAIPVSEKLTLIKEAFGTVREEVLNLLMILCERHSVHLFVAVAKHYNELYNESRGIIPAEIISAAPLSEEQAKRLTERLEAVTGKKIILRCTTDKSLLGGARLRYSGIQLDGSLKARLDSIESGLKSSVI